MFVLVFGPETCISHTLVSNDLGKVSDGLRNVSNGLGKVSDDFWGCQIA